MFQLHSINRHVYMDFKSEIKKITIIKQCLVFNV